jgi:VWFA-related protein
MAPRKLSLASALFIPAFALLPVVALLWTNAAAGAAPQPASSQASTLITIQVSAVDGHGQPVTDLRVNDFRVEYGGKPQPPAFARFLASRDPRTPLGTDEFSNRTNAPPSHSTVILFDLLNASFNERGRGWHEIVESLQHLESSDHFYLYLLTRDGSLYPVHALPAAEDQVGAAELPWTKQVEPLLDRAMNAVNRLELQDLRVDVNARVQATFHTVGQLAAQFAPLTGLKSLVWVSRGVPVADFGLDGQWRDNTALIHGFASDLARANIPVYAVDQASLGTSFSGSRDTLEEIASLTGGRWYPSDSTGVAITQAVNDARGAYQLGFYPSAKNLDGKSHKLRVTSVRKGVQVLARSQDYATDPAAVNGQDPTSK